MGYGAIDPERLQPREEKPGARARRRSSFDATGRSRFVGRRDELRALQAALAAARRGQGRTLLVAGEPGIGKSRLVAEVGERALTGGWRVVTGHCRVAEGAPALWVWIQISRALLAARGAAENPGQEAISADLADLLPREIAEPSAFRWEDGIGADASAERFRVMDALCRFLTTSANRNPLLLVLDDLHCADASTLVLLGMLAAEATSHPLVVVGAYRDVGPTPSGALAATIGELVRRDPSCRLDLRGLERRDIARFVGLTRRLEDSLLHSICETTTGNPLFVTEVVRWMEAGDGAWVADGTSRRLRVPPTVREAIAWRLGELGDVANVLEVASVFGRGFSAGDVARVTDRPFDRLDDLLAAALRERLLVESGGQLQFAHALVRDVLYDRLPRLRRCRLHEGAGFALEETEELHRFEVLEAIAWHVFRALPVGDSARAVDWMCRAGDAAMECLAYEEAAEHFGRALAALKGSAAAERRCDLLLRRGAALERAGDFDGGREVFLAAASLARRRGSAPRLAWAALGFVGATAARAPIDLTACALLSEARRALGDSDPALRVRLLSADATCRYFSRDAGLRHQLSDEAVALARASGDVQTLAVALAGRLLSQWSPARAEESLRIAEETVQVADEAEDYSLSFRAAMIAYSIRLVRADLAEAEHWWWRCQCLAERLRLPRTRWLIGVVVAARALLRGDLEESRQRTVEAGRFGRGIDESTAEHYELLQRFYLTCFSGDSVQGFDTLAAAVLNRLDPESSQITTYRVALSATLLWVGRREDASALFRAIIDDGLADIADDAFLFFSLGILAELCWRLGDAGRAERLHEHLAPHRNRIGVVSWGAASEGSLAHHLALLAACRERWDEAEELFAEAVAVNERLGLSLLAARTRHRHGEMLHRAGRARLRADQLLTAATATYRSCGASEPWPEASKAPTVAPRRVEALPRNLFAREGDVWTLVFADRVARLPHRRGLEQIAYLLCRPGVAVAAIELAAGAAPPLANGRGSRSASLVAEGLRVGVPGNCGPIVDARAAGSYRARLAELRAEADAAEAGNDLGRLDAVRTEIARLEEALAEALGRGGRQRLLGATTERARVAVRNNIVKALALIARDHPELHQHLALSLRTGVLCMYAPRQEVAWRFASAEAPPLPSRK